MKALVRDRYGPPDVLEVREIEAPLVTDADVLVRVRAASVNPFDWHSVTGMPYAARLQFGLRRPKRHVIGTDFAGTVEAVGAGVAGFRRGDEVFGARSGALAELVAVPEVRAVLAKPSSLTFEEAAAVPLAAITALQGLREKGRLDTGEHVLINGASGGVGTFAVQIAKALGAEATAVCSTRNVDAVRSLGADRVVDYTQADFTEGGERYDLILDIAGNRAWPEYRRVLRPNGRLVYVGGPKDNRWVGPLGNLIRMRLASVGGSRRVVPFIARITRESLAAVTELLEAGTVTPVIEQAYPLDEGADAFRHVGAGHARAKVVVTVT